MAIKPPQTVVDRIRLLLDEFWAGNQNEMARAVKCSQSALSKVLSGKARAGKRLLQAIASHPDVNAEWLIQGRGKRPSRPAGKVAVTVTHLPIARAPLPGDPRWHQVFLSGETFPVAPAHHRDSRYWLVLAANASILRHEGAGILPGDLLLMETDLTLFPTPESLDGLICAAWIGSDAGLESRRLELGIAEFYVGPDESIFRLATGEKHFHRWPGLVSVPATARCRDRASGKTVSLGETSMPAYRDENGCLREVPSAAYSPVSYQVRLEGFVGVCIGLFRRQWSVPGA